MRHGLGHAIPVLLRPAPVLARLRRQSENTVALHDGERLEAPVELLEMLRDRRQEIEAGGAEFVRRQRQPRLDEQCEQRRRTASFGLEDLVQQRGLGRWQTADFGHEGLLRRSQAAPAARAGVRDRLPAPPPPRRGQRRTSTLPGSWSAVRGLSPQLPRRDQAFQDQPQRPEWRAQGYLGEQTIDLIGRSRLEPRLSAACAARPGSTERAASAGLASVAWAGTASARAAASSVDTAGLGRRQPVGVFESRLAWPSGAGPAGSGRSGTAPAREPSRPADRVFSRTIAASLNMPLSARRGRDLRRHRRGDGSIPAEDPAGPTA